MITLGQANSYRRGEVMKEALRRELDGKWLEVRYRNYLHGGWLREDGSPAPPHRKAITFHEATKALFCPNCRAHVGQIGPDPDERWDCEACGAKELRLPVMKHEPGDWLMAAPSLTSHFGKTLNPYFEQRMADMIVWDGVIKHASAKTPIMYPLVNGDKVWCLSYEQYLKAGAQNTNPFEGPRWKGALFDEPDPYGVWVATKRGLMRWISKFDQYPYVQQYKILNIFGGNQSSKSFTANSAFCANVRGENPWDGSLNIGWGRTYRGMTALTQPWIFTEMRQKAWNLGGGNPLIFAIDFSTYDNPAMTPRAIKGFFAEGMDEETEQVRVHGGFKELSGRVIKEFREDLNTFDFNPLVRTDGEPSSWPVLQVVDPHDKRPWFVAYAAVSPEGELYFYDEWPRDDFRRMKAGIGGFDEYAELFREIEDGLPGGPQRVMWRAMDPNFGETEKVGSVRKTVSEEMADRGFFYETEINNRLEYGHARLRSMFKVPNKDEPLSRDNRPKLYIHRTCGNLIASLHNYIYQDKTNLAGGQLEKVMEEFKDPIDTLRYAIQLPYMHVDWRSAYTSFDDEASRVAAAAAYARDN